MASVPGSSGLRVRLQPPRRCGVCLFPESNAHRHELRNHFTTFLRYIVRLWLKPCSLKSLSFRKQQGWWENSRCYVKLQSKWQLRNGLAWLVCIQYLRYLICVALEVEKINYPWSLLLEPVCCFKSCGLHAQAAALRTNLNAFPLRAHWNSTEC